jgi:hypothetical protein
MKKSELKNIIKEEILQIFESEKESESSILKRIQKNTEPTKQDIWHFITGRKPVGYAINRGGPHGIDTKTEIWKMVWSPSRNLWYVLAKVIGGYHWLLYKKNDVTWRK